MSVETYAAIFGAFYWIARLIRSYSMEKAVEIEERRAVVTANVRLEVRVKELEHALETTEKKLIEYDQLCSQVKKEMLQLQIQLEVLRNNQEKKHNVG